MRFYPREEYGRYGRDEDSRHRYEDEGDGHGGGRRGFGGMDPERRREMARRGGESRRPR
jgi:hypothetical protein